MVKGLDRFKDFFADCRDCCVLTGGSACGAYFADQDIPFRVTRDLDMILCVEASPPALGAPCKDVFRITTRRFMKNCWEN